MFEAIKNALLKSLLYLLLIVTIVGIVRYFQGPTALQFIGPENIYTIQPWMLTLVLLLLWLVWVWLRVILRGFFMRLPSAISFRVKRGISRRHNEHLHQSIAHLVRGETKHALANLKKYIKEIRDVRHSVHLWALGVFSFLSAGEVAAARSLYEIHENTQLDESSEETTRTLVQVRLLLAEDRMQTAVTALLRALTRFPENPALTNELQGLVNNQALRGSGLILLSEVEDSEIPSKIRKSTGWQRLRALKKLREGQVGDEWIAALDNDIRLHESFVLARLRKLAANNQIDECYRVALESLRHQWSAEVREFILALAKPEEESLLADFQALKEENS